MWVSRGRNTGLAVWSEFFFAITFIQDDILKPADVLIALLGTEYTWWKGSREREIGYAALGGGRRRLIRRHGVILD